MNQTDYWNSVANEKRFTTTFQENIFCKYVDKSAKILDVGCGYGRTLNEMYNAGYKNLVGADTSIEMLNRGKREFPHIEFVQSSEIFLLKIVSLMRLFYLVYSARWLMRILNVI